VTNEFLKHRLSRRTAVLGGSALAAASAINLPLLASAQDAAVEPGTQPVEPVALEIKDVYTFVVAGLDTRSVLDDENTDVLMVSRVNLAEGSVRTMSFPRDLLVEIPGIGFDKITRAYDYGSKADNSNWNTGVQLLQETIDWNFGLGVDAVATTRFDGLENVVDALGGITIENPYDVYDATYPTRDFGTKEIFYPAGTLELNGEQALELARTRHQDGDDGRVMRQQLILSALLEKAQEPETLKKLPQLLEAARASDVLTNIPAEVQAHLLSKVGAINPDLVEWGTMTHLLWGDTTASGMWVYQGDWTVLPGYVQGFLNGEI
jgi:LCP family protein required for cell wall assembly